MLHPGSEVEVRCHPGCPWVTAWAVVEVVLLDGTAHYRVRRQGHPRPLDALLPADDVRPAAEVLATRAS